MRRFAIFALPLAFLALACGGQAEPAPEIELTGDHLKAMVLTKEDFGPDYAEFELDRTSGLKTTEHLVENADNPEDEALDVGRFGTIMGHVDLYASARNLSNRSGVVYISNAVILYGDAKGAAADLDDILADAKRDLSGTTEMGSLQSFKTFKAGVGDKSFVVVVRFLTPGSYFGLTGNVNLTVTAVEFRRDRLLGEVTIMRFDAKDVKDEAIDLARKLDQRIQLVLGGAPEPPAAEAP